MVDLNDVALFVQVVEAGSFGKPVVGLRAGGVPIGPDI